MSKLTGFVKVIDSVTGNVLFDGSLSELFETAFPKKVFLKSELTIKCDCFYFKFII